MGARAATVALLWAATAHAQPECRPLDARGRPYAVCFDPGNRLVVGGAADLEGPVFEGGIQLRHYVDTDDPSIRWRFEHHGLAARAGLDRWEALVYSGRFMRHSRDGRLVIPTSPPKPIFLPFDVGAEVVLGRARGLREATDFRLGVVRAVALVDLARSSDFRRRLAFGPVAEWDIRFSRDENDVEEHQIVPFSTMEVGLYVEDRPGLTYVQVVLEGGMAWSDATHWGRRLSAEASLERVFAAVNDRPLSVFLAGRWDEPEGLYAQAGLRLALVGRAR